METNITVITNSKCKEDMNTVTKKSILKKIGYALPNGLDNGLMCGEGSCDGGVCRGACKVRQGTQAVFNVYPRETLVDLCMAMTPETGRL